MRSERAQSMFKHFTCILSNQKLHIERNKWFGALAQYIKIMFLHTRQTNEVFCSVWMTLGMKFEVLIRETRGAYILAHVQGP